MDSAAQCHYITLNMQSTPSHTMLTHVIVNCPLKNKQHKTMKQVVRSDIKLLLIQSLNVPIFQVALDKKDKFLKCNVTKHKS